MMERNKPTEVIGGDDTATENRTLETDFAAGRKQPTDQGLLEEQQADIGDVGLSSDGVTSREAANKAVTNDLIDFINVEDGVAEFMRHATRTVTWLREADHIDCLIDR